MTMDELKHFRQLGSQDRGPSRARPRHRHRDDDRPARPGPRQLGGLRARRAPCSRARFGADVVDHFTYVHLRRRLPDGRRRPGGDHAGGPSRPRPADRAVRQQRHLDRRADLALHLGRPQEALRAAGWHVQEVDGLDQEAVTRAIRKARNVADKPSMIACKTIIGYGAPTKAGTAATHGSPLGKDEVAGARQKLGWPYPPFEIPEPIFTAWRKIGAQAASRQRRKWIKRHAAMAEADRAEFDRRQKGDIPPAVDEAIARLQGQDGGREALAGRRASRARKCSRSSTRCCPTRSAARPISPARTTPRPRRSSTQTRGRAGRPLHPLRHPRARDGRGDERPGAAWRRHPLRRHLPGVHRLLPRRRSACRR